MTCPECGASKSKVINSVSTKLRVYRIRKCSVCNHEFGTVESAGNTDSIIHKVKKLRSKQRYRSKAAKDGELSRTSEN